MIKIGQYYTYPDYPYVYKIKDENIYQTCTKKDLKIIIQLVENKHPIKDIIYELNRPNSGLYLWKDIEEDNRTRLERIISD